MTHKEQMELRNLRRRVEAQREEIRRLQEAVHALQKENAALAWFQTLMLRED